MQNHQKHIGKLDTSSHHIKRVKFKEVFSPDPSVTPTRMEGIREVSALSESNFSINSGRKFPKE